MNGSFPQLDELRELLNALCEETIGPEQMGRLEEIVLASPEAEVFYVQFLSLHAELVARFGVLPARLEQTLRERLGAEQPSAPRPQAAAMPAEATPASRPWVRRVLWDAVVLSALAAAVFLALTFWPRESAITPPAGATPEATDNSVAVLIQAPGATWGETTVPTRPGSPLPPGKLHLKSGYAYIEFYSGATVLLQGEAKFELVSRTRANCSLGKLRAHVPTHAQGFTIGSPKLDLVDRGTEFGFEVKDGGQTEVQVFHGKVELYNPGEAGTTPPHTELLTDQGVHLDDAGKSRPVQPKQGDFLSARQLAERLQTELVERQKAWLRASAELRGDPTLVVYYPFQNKDSWSRTLPDEAGERKQARDGAIVGCTWGTGRWQGRQGLEFKRVSDRVRVHVPGEFESLTMMAWVRVDALPNRNNSLFMADGWEVGEAHWQIGDNGTLILGVQSQPKGRGAHYHAPEVFIQSRLGRWLQLAVVYDREAGQVSHYVDGVIVAQDHIQFDIPLRVGDASIGNWDLASHKNNTPIRYLSGCMDEFLLFSRALTEAEIEQLYLAGRPPM